MTFDDLIASGHLNYVTVAYEFWRSPPQWRVFGSISHPFHGRIKTFEGLARTFEEAAESMKAAALAHEWPEAPPQITINL